MTPESNTSLDEPVIRALLDVLELARELNERSWSQIEQSALSRAIVRADAELQRVREVRE